MRRPSSIQLSIPTPCNEDWNKMTPTEQGRYCAQCCKTVVDFTGWTNAQIYNHILINSNTRICGRFYNTQLNQPISFPSQPHSRLYSYMVALGLSLLFIQSPSEKLYARAPYTYRIPIIDTQAVQTKPADSVTVKGQIVGPNKKPLPEAMIVLSANGTMNGTFADENGYFSFAIPHASGKVYTLKVTTPGYFAEVINLTENNLANNHVIQLKHPATSTIGLMEIKLITYKVPLIDPFEPNKTVITDDEIEKGAY